MNLIKLQDEISKDEGVKYETYRCSLGHLTGGIGHLITEWDEEIYSGPKFKNMIAAVGDLDWAVMADEMENSNWFKQTTNRAERLIARVDRQLTRELPI